MSKLHSRIYLVSQSPNHRDSLKQIGIGFELLLLRNSLRREIDVDESPRSAEAPSEYLERICRAKVEAGQHALLSRGLRAFPVLTAESVLTLDSRIIGKPLDQKESAAILRELSGRQHQLISAVAVAFQGRVELRLATTTVTFATLDEERIGRYVIANEGHDKAGAYAIDGLGGAFVERIEGSHSALIGLPLFETVELLRAFGLPVP